TASSSPLIEGFLFIKSRLEGRGTDAAIGGQEIFVLPGADLQISVDDAFDRIDDFIRRKAGSGDFADSAILVARAAERDLIGFNSLLLEAENADMANVMMAAGIDAAGNLDLQVADVARPVRIAEPF